MISFVVPAHNEETLLDRTLAALHESARAIAEPYEIVVVNDASTDRTGEIALTQRARVISVSHRQIAATRNAGAAAATGEILIFVDADTMVTEPALRAAIEALRRGAVGGGASIRFDKGPLPFYATILEFLLPTALRILRLAPGCFIFCTRQAYHVAGGFDESLYAAEEVRFADRLRRQGEFVILREFVITSARKLRTRSAFQLLRVGLRLAIRGEKSLLSRDELEFWYGPRNPEPGLPAKSD
jgi:glycosyltransferase involved in cell wall biosynthesis